MASNRCYGWALDIALDRLWIQGRRSSRLDAGRYPLCCKIAWSTRCAYSGIDDVTQGWLMILLRMYKSWQLKITNDWYKYFEAICGCTQIRLIDVIEKANRGHIDRNLQRWLSLRMYANSSHGVWMAVPGYGNTGVCLRNVGMVLLPQPKPLVRTQPPVWQIGLAKARIMYESASFQNFNDKLWTSLLDCERALKIYVSCCCSKSIGCASGNGNMKGFTSESGRKVWR